MMMVQKVLHIDSKGNIVGNEEEINGVRYRVIETDEMVNIQKI